MVDPEWASGLYCRSVSQQSDRRVWDSGVQSAGRDLGWKVAGGGFIYRSSDEYIFELSAPAPGEGRQQRGALLAKPLALDPIFWEIIGSPELLRKRLAFRVNGAFTLPGFDIGEVLYTSESAPESIVGHLDDRFSQVEPELRSVDAFESLIKAHLPPRNGGNLATCVAWYIALERPADAAPLIREAVGSDLGGGFGFPGGTFEELALDHLGLENERGHHGEQIDGRFRRIFPGARWTPEQRLRMDLERMDGVEHFALALWKLPEDADRRVPDGRWDTDSYIQCAGGPDRFVIETRRPQGDLFEQAILGHGGSPIETIDVRRGDFTSTVSAAEVFTRDETLDVLLHYIEHETTPKRLESRRLDLAPDGIT